MNTSPSGFWGNMTAYTVSLLKAWWGSRATPENDFCFDYLPAHHRRPLHLPDRAGHARRHGQGLLRGRREPGGRLGERRASPPGDGRTSTGSSCATSSRPRSAAFWYDSPEVESGELDPERDRHRGLLPAGRRAHREGRLVHEHPAPAPVAPQGGRAAGRLPLGALVLLPPRAPDPREAGRLGGGARPAGQGAQPGTTRPPARSPSRAPRRCCARSTAGTRRRGALGLRRAEGRRLDRLRLLDLLRLLRRRDEPARAPQPPASEQSWVAPEWGGPGPRTGASSTTGPPPTPRGGRGRSARSTSGGTRTRGSGRARTCPTSSPTSGPTTGPPDGAKAQDAIAGNHPFIMQPDGRGLAVRARRGSSTARFRPTTSRDESPLTNPLYGQAANPARQRFRRPGNERNPPRRPVSLRLHDLPPDRAPHGGRHEPLRPVPLRAPAGHVLRGEPRARRASAASPTAAGPRSSRPVPRSRRGCVVTERMAPVASTAAPCTRSAFRTTGARRGLTTGDSANDLLEAVLDPNVHIQESKVATCDIRPGRRSRGNGRAVRG